MLDKDYHKIVYKKWIQSQTDLHIKFLKTKLYKIQLSSKKHTESEINGKVREWEASRSEVLINSFHFGDWLYK